MIDYAALLEKYMVLILQEQGVTFLEYSYSDTLFTQEELTELLKIHDSIRDHYKDIAL
jgi:hypothetical protein